MSNYSYSTSLPAFKENQALHKRTQCDNVLALIRKGSDNLLQVSQLTGLPQSTIAGRVNDLVNDGRVKYFGQVVYNNRLRKKIIIIEPVAVGVQADLFN